MPYELLDHTADTGIEARGVTLDAAFAAAIEGFAAIVHQDADVEATDTTTVAVEAGNLESLLFDLLDRLIYLQDAEGLLVCGVDGRGDGDAGGLGGARAVTVEETDDGWRVEASVATAPLERGMGLLDIKAPTYHEMRVEETSGGWVVSYVLDI